MKINMILKYPILTLLSRGKRSFENMGRLVKRSGDTVSRWLRPEEISLEEIHYLCKMFFSNSPKLFVSIDDTLIKKFYSRFMQGAGMHFDNTLYRRIMAYRTVVGIISNGKYSMPFGFEFIFAKELIDASNEKYLNKDEIAKIFVKTAQKLFPSKKLIVVVDGLYTTINICAMVC